MDKYLANSARWRESRSSSSSEIANFTVNYLGEKTAKATHPKKKRAIDPDLKQGIETSSYLLRTTTLPLTLGILGRQFYECQGGIRAGGLSRPHDRHPSIRLHRICQLDATRCC